MVAKVEFPIGKKLFHLVVNPSTWRCPTVDLELVQTTRNVNGTRHSVRKFQPGKRDHLFRFSTFSGNFPVGRTDETCSIYRRGGWCQNGEHPFPPSHHPSRTLRSRFSLFPRSFSAIQTEKSASSALIPHGYAF